MPRRAMPCVAAFVGTWILLAGCGAADRAARETSSVSAPASTASVEAAGEAAEASDATAEGVKPRIIYTADVRLVADDFAKAAEQLKALVEEVDGYVASASLDRSSGERRSGSWTVRVPVAAYERFLASLDSIAFVESRDQRSEDVTMEYVDVEARIANLQRLEERFVTLLAEKTGKLEDVLKVEQELARVRGDIEQSQGRMRYLTNKTDFSTVTVAIREQKDYVPPKAPEFGDRIATTWSQSIAALRRTGEFVVLAIVAVFPWLVVAAVPVVGLIVAIRLALRHRASARTSGG
ncbi:MAG: DUF4349 domain-containing protein [Planctomycetaceae bacterium]